MRVTRWLLAVMAVVAFGNALAAEGEDYPRRAVKLVLPNAPGSSSDTLARILAQYLGIQLGQPVVVENYAGGGGLIGMDMVKNAAPDGYTLVAVTPAGTSIAANLRKQLSYDPLNDFQYVSMYAVLPNMLVVTPSLPVKTVQDLIDYANNAKADTFMASAGTGSQSHLAGAMLETMGHFPSVHVPYKGGGASVLAVMTGEAQWTITPASSVLGHVRGGKLRAIAQSMPERMALMPEVPTVSETIPGYNYSGWNGIAVPRGTPAAIVEKIRAALLKTVAMPEVKDAFGRQGATVVTNTSQEFRAIVRRETEATAAVVKAANVQVD